MRLVRCRVYVSRCRQSQMQACIRCSWDLSSSSAKSDDRTVRERAIGGPDDPRGIFNRFLAALRRLVSTRGFAPQNYRCPLVVPPGYIDIDTS